MLEIAVLVSGGGTNLQAIIDRMEDGTIKNTRIKAVISNNPNAYALERAKQHGIQGVCLSPKQYDNREDFHQALLKCLQDLSVELIVLAGFMVVLPESIIKYYKNRIINVHPSLIPAFCGTGYYGLKVHEAALTRGVKISGATVHFVDGGTDTGPIIMQQAVTVLPEDTPQSLQRRIMEEAEWLLLPQVIDAIANGRIIVNDDKVIHLNSQEEH